MRPPRLVLALVGLAAIVLVGAVSMVSAGSGAPEPAPGPTASATATPSPSPSPEPPSAPLTGAPATDGDLDERPALAVKVENSTASRPQSGLDVADVVYEELTEGGITRFIAIFHSRVPQTVGPIRSGRLVDAVVLPAYRPLMALSGARQEVIDALARAGVETLYDDGMTFYRESGRRSPHNLFARGDDLYAAAEDAGLRGTPRAWTFDPAPPRGQVACPEPVETGEPVETETCTDPGAALEVRMSPFSVTGWEYDAKAGVYRRLQDGQPHRVTGEGRIGAANVLVVGTQVGPGGCCDSAGNALTRTEVLGQGPGVVLRDGRRYDVSWSKPGAGSHLAVRGADGRPFAFKPGPTWVLLAPREALPPAP